MDWTGGIRAVRARGLTASILGSAVLSCLVWLPIHAEARRHGRMSAVLLFEQLHQAVRSYELDWGDFPTGDGNGSRGLARALEASAPGRPCGSIEPSSDPREGVLRDGQIANPIAPGAPWPFGIVHYRRNPPGARPPFELWVHDPEGATILEPRP